jgi:hypothetical protein
MAPTLETEPSNYMQTLTRYLSNIMNSTLLGLPREIKELIYFDALSRKSNHFLPRLSRRSLADRDPKDAANMILALPLSPEVKKINPNGVAALAKDVAYLAQFVDGLDNAMILKENLDELQQTVLLMETVDPNEYFDNAIRNRKFGRVDPLNGPRILEKYVQVFFPSFCSSPCFGCLLGYTRKMDGQQLTSTDLHIQSKVPPGTTDWGTSLHALECDRIGWERIVKSWDL